MRVSYLIDGKKRSAELPKGATVGELVTKAGFNSEIVLVRIGGEIVPEDTKLTGKGRIELLRVVSGG